ncbi:hypothetical protein WJX73_007193 [Symbiochloris irregularis]|uniref:30S ribosomal protein S13, chloroplastic n=1 Tax=Symbiochloris irregularis TaxID=706552 RepID=A0AAW1Q4F9_9CHLO
MHGLPRITLERHAPATTLLRSRPQATVQSRQPLRVQAARVAGVDIPNQKRIEFSLRYIYGIGPTTSKAILDATGIENKRTKDLSEEELSKLREEVDNYQLEGDLRRAISQDIKRLKDIGSYRGRRHIMGLPCRGQRTKNNCRTRKGRRKTVTGGSK